MAPTSTTISRRLRGACLTLEILDSDRRGRSRPLQQRPEPNGWRPTNRTAAPAIPNTTALWRVPPAPFSAAAGVHRVAWDPNAGRRRRGPRGGANQPPPPKLPGTFTAKLTVNGQSQTKSFMVRPDPRIANE